MTKWLAGAAAALGAGAATLGLIVPLPAGAAAPDAQGWWTAANTGLPAPPTNPDIPPDGLLVQGGGSGPPTAYAALLYQLPAGAAAQTLTLAVTANSGTTPLASLEVCPLREPTFRPEQGGAIARAPAYNCATKVTAGPSSSGKTYQFNLTGLGASKSVAIAVLPTSPTDRVVLDKPNADSLTIGQSAVDTTPAPAVTDPSAAVSPPSSGSAPTGPSADTPAPPAAPQADITASDPTSSAQGSPSSPPLAAPDSVPTPATVPPTPVASTTGSVGQLASSPTSPSSKGTPVAAGLVLLGVVGSALLWVFAGRGAPAEL